MNRLGPCLTLLAAAAGLSVAAAQTVLTQQDPVDVFGPDEATPGTMLGGRGGGCDAGARLNRGRGFHRHGRVETGAPDPCRTAAAGRLVDERVAVLAIHVTDRGIRDAPATGHEKPCVVGELLSAR